MNTTRRTLLQAGCAAVAAGFALSQDANAECWPLPGGPDPGTLIPIEGALNVRDIGGYRVPGGHTVRFGRIYRAGTFAFVTERGVKQLAALGLKEVIDFRTAAEAQSQGPDRLPTGVAPISIPVGEKPTRSGPETAWPLAMSSAVDPDVLNIYRGYVSYASWRKGFGQALRRVANTAEHPLAYHDSAGAHRSGWLTAIVLTLLGVDKDTVYGEYLRSNEALGGIYAYTEYLDAGFTQATKEYGSFRDFVVRGLDFTPPMIIRLRDALLTAC